MQLWRFAMGRYGWKHGLLAGRRDVQRRGGRDWGVTALEGRVLLTVTDVMTGATFATIQAAVAAAAAGTTLQVSPGTYPEQVTIGKSLTLEGTAPGAIIQAPSTLTTDTFNLRVLLEVNNAAT